MPKCDQDSGGLFKRKSPEEYYFIDDTPQLAYFTKDSIYQLKQRWDFADYVHDSNITRAASDPRLYIHPVLYPLSKEQWAIALIKGASDWFPGGAATEEVRTGRITVPLCSSPPALTPPASPQAPRDALPPPPQTYGQ